MTDKSERDRPSINSFQYVGDDRFTRIVLRGSDVRRPEDGRVVDENRIICHVPPHADSIVRLQSGNQPDALGSYIPLPKALRQTVSVFRVGWTNNLSTTYEGYVSCT